MAAQKQTGGRQKSTGATRNYHTEWSKPEKDKYHMVLEKTLENPLDWKQIKPLKEINPAYSLEALLVELKLQYFDHLMQRTDSLEKTLMLGKMKRKKRRGQQRMRWLDGITNSMDMNVSKPQETVKDREAWHALVHVVANNQTWLSDWTTTKVTFTCEI